MFIKINKKRTGKTMKNYMVKCKYFFGNKISDYGLKNGYVDYETLAKAFDAVLNNDIIENTINIGFWEQVNGFKEEDYPPEIFQYYIISESGANILCEFTDEIVFYNEDLNMYVWGVCHFGTAWNYVLTDISVNVEG